MRADRTLGLILLLILAGCATVDPVADDGDGSDDEDVGDRDRGSDDENEGDADEDTSTGSDTHDDTSGTDAGEDSNPQDTGEDTSGEDTTADAPEDTTTEDTEIDLPVGTACESDADCSEPTPVCALIRRDDKMETECQAALGVGGPGATCTSDSQCQSGVCLFDLFCAAPCADTEECPREGDVCGAFTFILDTNGTPDQLNDDITSSANICLPAGAGTLEPCLTIAQCFVGGETCGLFVDSERGAERRCRPAIGGTETGSCETGDDCATGVCLGGGVCYWPCADDDDCDGLGECLDIDFEGLESTPSPSAPSCFPACTSSEDCISTDVCAWFGDDDPPNQLVNLCVPAVGTLESGATCTTPDQCKSGDCFDYGGDLRCAGPCDPETQAGCAVGTRCYADSIHVQFDQDTPEDLGDDLWYAFATCQPDFGSYEDCSVDADCPANEACMATLDTTLTGLHLRCVDSVGATGGGAVCASDSVCYSGFCLGDGICFESCDPIDGSSECAAGSCQITTFIVDERDPDDEEDDVTDDIYICR